MVYKYSENGLKATWLLAHPDAGAPTAMIAIQETPLEPERAVHPVVNQTAEGSLPLPSMVLFRG